MSQSDVPLLFTIGHSDHETPELIELLVRHGVSVVADVRSQPYSRHHDQFNRETLAQALEQSGIAYAFLGRELGARRNERESYQGGQARYDLISRLPAFQRGLERLRSGLATHRIALLCAEKDPITCHRMVLICRQLRSDPILIQHILDDGNLESMTQAESRLLEAARVPSTHLFKSRNQLVELAYDIQGERIAYTEADEARGPDGDTA